MTDIEVEQQFSGTVVLVHGSWGHPDDWQWVRAPLDAAGLDVIAMDLPSHNDAQAGLRDDAIAIQDAVRTARGPVVALGWSYGAEAVCEAVAIGTPLAHLIVLGSIPMPGGIADHSWIDAAPNILKFDDGRYVLDATWFLENDGRTLPEPVQAELRRLGRRPTTRGTLKPVSSAAWTELPVTIMVGDHDPFITPEKLAWAEERFDTRVVPGDHFVLFRTPEIVSDLVLEVMRSFQVPRNSRDGELIRSGGATPSSDPRP